MHAIFWIKSEVSTVHHWVMVGNTVSLLLLTSVIVVSQCEAPSVSGPRANAAHPSLFPPRIYGPLNQMEFKYELHCINLYLTRAKHYCWFNVIVLLMCTPCPGRHHIIYCGSHGNTARLTGKYTGFVWVHSWPLVWCQSWVCVHILLVQSDAGCRGTGDWSILICINTC